MHKWPVIKRQTVQPVYIFPLSGGWGGRGVNKERYNNLFMCRV